MKYFLILFVCLCFYINHFIENDVVGKGKMILCYSAGAKNYIPFIIDYKCILVLRGSGY